MPITARRSIMFGLMIKAGKIVIAAGASMLIFETAAHGCEMLRSDAKALKELYKYKTNPTPYYGKKKGYFQKKELIKINPITGSISSYSGARTPDCKTIVRY